MKSFVAKKNDENKRLDVFVAEKISELSRSSVQKLCDMEKIKVNDQIQLSNKRLNSGDTVKVDFDLKKLNEIPKINLPIIYEDVDVIVINKPEGLLTHSKGAFNPEPTVASFIKSKLHVLEGERAGIVHRLDRGTSGVIICAKNPEALKWLQKQFSQRKAKKEYLAIVEGEPEPPKAVIDMPIARNPAHPQTFKVSELGKSAITTYETINAKNGYSLLKLMPQTGRTHQLRVHLKQLNHPIVGDNLYKGKPGKRLYLHASKLEVTLPSRERRVFELEPPKDFMEPLNA